MGMIRVSHVFLLTFFCSSFANADWCSEDIEKLAWVASANAKQDALAALDSQNSKYMAVFGFTIIVPGVTDAESFKITTDKNYTAIEGTGDALCSDEHAKLNQRAIEYATVYNQTIRAGL